MNPEEIVLRSILRNQEVIMSALMVLMDNGKPASGHMEERLRDRIRNTKWLLDLQKEERYDEPK